MRHEVLLGRKEEDGTSWRDHLAEKARRGDGRALRELDGPEAPEALVYLKEWAFALCGRSGASMDGLAPLSYGTIAEWARLTGNDPDPLEVRALIALDAVIRKPESGEQEEEPEPPQEDVAWPERK